MIAALVTLVSSLVLAETIIGQASVIYGDTLEIHEQGIRLFGMDAPELDQLCRGDESLQYRCGPKAANKLARFIVAQKEAERAERGICVRCQGF